MEKNKNLSQNYLYKGDRFTDPELKGMECQAVRQNGKCIRGKNGNMLVKFSNGITAVVLARQLRKIKNDKFMKIKKIGTFVNGVPYGWNIDCQYEPGSTAVLLAGTHYGSNGDSGKIVLEITEDERVLIGGVEVEQWTNDLRASKTIQNGRP